MVVVVNHSTKPTMKTSKMMLTLLCQHYYNTVVLVITDYDHNNYYDLETVL